MRNIFEWQIKKVYNVVHNLQKMQKLIFKIGSSWFKDIK